MNLIKLVQGSSELVLLGSGAAAPVRGAVLDRAASEEESIETVITVSLEGTAAQIETTIGTLQGWLTEAGRVGELAGVDYVFLAAQVLAAGTTWRSKVLGGWVEVAGAGPGQRARGAQGLKLHVRRVNYWEDSTESSLSVSSVYNSGGTALGARVNNAWDAMYGNWVHLAAGVLGGDLPTPARLYYDSSLSSNGTLLVGQNVSSDPAGAGLALEGEAAGAVDGVTKSTQSDGSASGGQFARLTWSGTASAGLLDFSLSSGLVTDLGGWPFLPVLRLVSAAPAGLWCSWRTIARHVNGDNVLNESRPGYLSAGGFEQPGTPLHLPPWQPVPGEAQSELVLQLRAEADGSGSHTLDVDCLFLLPLEYWRIYRPVMAYMNNLRINDDGYRGVVQSYGSMQGHTADGPGFWLWPGRAQRFYFVAEGIGARVAADTNATVRLYARARRKVL